MSEPLLKVEHLKKYFPIKGGILQHTVGHIKAVEDVSLTIDKGETYGLVGESGCGKSTTGRTILRLYEKTGGSVYFKGKSVHDLSRKELRDLRPKMQMVFQDPYSSLNPRMTVGEIISEALVDHGMCTRKEAREKTLDIMEKCGLRQEYIDRYPHEFSGGQRQRIGIARALALEPEFIVCDEPVSALDVSIQAQIVNLLCELQQQFKISYLFISHDLSVVRYISHRIGVMYLGSLIETAPKDELYQNPLHPYTEALLSAIPSTNPEIKPNRIILPGDLPSPANPPAGCPFHTRCPKCMEICKTKRPEVKDVGNGHKVACHLVK